MSARHDCAAATGPAALSRAETLVLWCLRAWVAGHRAGVEVMPNIRTALTLEGVETAAEPLAEAMAMLGRGAGRAIAINCPRCPEVTDDERRILDLMALYQRGATIDAAALLHGLATPAAARLCGPLFHDLAVALLGGGVRLPLAAWPEGRLRPEPAAAVPAGVTVH